MKKTALLIDGGSYNRIEASDGVRILTPKP